MKSRGPRRVTDLALAQRLERTEASSNAAFVDARVAVDPTSGACWRDVGGAYAMFDGVGSPISQTFGLGLFSTPNDEQLAEIEQMFGSRGSETHHEVCPMADPELLNLLPRRGYQPFEWSSVLHRDIADDNASLSLDENGTPRAPTAIITRRIGPEESDAWAHHSALGWAHIEGLQDFMENFGRIMASARGVHCFVAELGGTIVATGGMTIHGGVALLAGASTRPEWRKRGAQTALLEARLAYARNAGCDIAMMAAAPGSTSQMNAERQGFAIAYTRIKWRLPLR